MRRFDQAGRGLAVLLQTQPNARIHAVATIAVLAAGALFGISPSEWALVALVVACVWVAEGLNTAIEMAVDLASPDRHPLAAKAKDVAAGAVLVAAIGSLVVAVAVFGPYVMDWVRR